MIDIKTIEACKRKERTAFKQCYEACAPYVYTIIKNYISNADDQKDAMQEVFAHIFHSIHKFDPIKGSFKTWLSRITINQSITFIKRNKRYSYLVPLSDELENLKEDTELQLDTFDISKLKKIIEKMPVGYKTIFMLSYVEGYTHDEIAEILDLSSKTSRSQLSRAIKWLRNHYKEYLKQFNYG